MTQELYVVTGAAGFIGSNIVERLLAEGCRVRGVDNFATGRRENIAPFLDRMEFCEGDLADEGVADTALQGATYVIHQAAIPSVPKSVDHPLPTNRSCVDATIRLLMAARDAGVKRVVIAASSSAYGDSEISPKVETLPTRPLSPYAVAKLTQEYYCQAFSTCYGIETVALRYFNVFGPRQDPTSDYAAVIPLFIRIILSGKVPTIFGDGTQSRDFTFIENVVHANLLAARAPGRFLGEVINVACGYSVDLNQLVQEINGVLGTDVKPTYAPARAGDVKHSLADIAKAKRLLGYEPQVDFQTGLERTAAWLKTQMTS